MAWYNKYRPTRFDQVIGQGLVKEILIKTIAAGKIKHAYLLCGPKGTGKTTIARIMAGQINSKGEQSENEPSSKSLDIIEMDAASNTGIDDIRALIESAKNPPLIGPYKIYIIDEVHMLSKSAMNALLKILEEPPIYLVFLLATTNPEKLLGTILSRVTRLNLKSHSIDDITGNLKKIAENENLKIDKESLSLIASRSGGAQRDAINTLETLAGYQLDFYSYIETSRLLGVLPKELLAQTTNQIWQSQINSQLIENLEKTGVEGEQFLIQLFNFLLELSIEICFENENGDENTGLEVVKQMVSETGIENMDLIIETLGELISLKLPYPTVVSAISALQSKIRRKNPQNKSDNKSEMGEKKSLISAQINPEKNLKKPETPKKKQGQDSDQKDKKEDFENNKIDKNDSQINQIIQLFKNKNYSPKPIFLTVIGDDLIPESLEMVEIDGIWGNILNISVSNGLFASQLSSLNKITTLKTIIKNELGIEISDIKTVQRKNEKNNLGIEISTNYDHITPEKVEFVGKNHKNQTNQSPEPENEKNSESQTEKEPGETKTTYFYKIYKYLKVNMQDKGLEIYTENIPPKPEKSKLDNDLTVDKQTQDSNWADEISDFELE